MPRGINNETIVTASAIQIADNGASVQNVRLLPLGTFKLRDKRNWTVKNPEQIVEKSLAAAGKQELPVDYDHQLLFAAAQGKGGTAIASGWIKNLTVGADGIYADIEWTEAASAKIKAKEYRYISPTVVVDQNNSVIRIVNAGLTNEPAIDGLAVLAASNQLNEDNMDLTALAASLGLPATATLEEITAAQKTQAASLAAASADIESIKTALGLDKKASGATLVAAASKIADGKQQAKEGEIIVPASIWEDTQTQLKTLVEDKVISAIEAASKAGKISPAQKELMTDFAKKDFAAFQNLMAVTPSITEAASANNKIQTQAGQLDEVEITVCASLGLTEEEFKAAKAKEA